MGMWQFKRSPVLRICSPLAYLGYAKQRASFWKWGVLNKVSVFPLGYTCSIIEKLVWDAVYWQVSPKYCTMLFISIRNTGEKGKMWFGFPGENIILLNSNHTITLFHNNNFITGSTGSLPQNQKNMQKETREEKRERGGWGGREGGGERGGEEEEAIWLWKSVAKSDGLLSTICV